MWFNFITASMTLAILLLIWFNTEAFIEYAQVFKITDCFKIDEFIKVRQETQDPSLTYLTFIAEHYDCFLVRLITCPICLSIWLGFILSIFLASFKLCLAISFLGLSLYYALIRLMRHE